MVGKVVDDLLRVLSLPVVRYPVLNREPRIQLDARLWHLIHERDGGVCWICSVRVAKGAGEVDHLVPRSSYCPEDVGLADRSWNLRLACVDCNQGKSNFRVPVLPRTLGITSRCWDCFERRDLGGPDPELAYDDWCRWVEGREGSPVLSVSAYCGSCGLTSRVPDESWVL